MQRIRTCPLFFHYSYVFASGETGDGSSGCVPGELAHRNDPAIRNINERR
jgi:hypothetical protein